MTALGLLVLTHVVLFSSPPETKLEGMFAVGPGCVVIDRFAGQILIVHIVRVPAKERRAIRRRHFTRVHRWPARCVEGVGHPQFGRPVGGVGASAVVNGGSVHAD